MPVAVHCPSCSKELLAPDELVGKLAACPQCDTQFPVAAQAAGMPPAAMTAGAASSDRSRQDLLTGSHPGALAPPPHVPSGESSADPLSRQSTAGSIGLRGPGESQVVGAAPTTPPSQVHPSRASASEAGLPAAESTPQQASRSSRKPARPAETARFVSAEAADTHVQLGEDGQLPSLVLDDRTRSDARHEQPPGSNPWLLFAALGFSFAASAALLLLDTPGRRSEPRSKSEARGQLEAEYTRSPTDAPFLEPYQELLRRALQAHNREDYATEQKLYRRVLNMLHAENNSENQGLTGQVRADEPPNDEHLEDLLSTLISN